MNHQAFHFNCAMCGVSPEPFPLQIYLDEWTTCPAMQIRTLLKAQSSLVRVIESAPGTRLNKATRSQLRALLTALDAFCHAPASHEAIANRRESGGISKCPMCNSGFGSLNPSRYFTHWEEACWVQVANLLYETSLVVYAVLRGMPEWIDVPAASALGRILELHVQTLNKINLLTCWFCGRRTSFLYGDGSKESPHRCRWCADASGEATFVTFTVRPSAPESTEPFDIDAAFPAFDRRRLGHEIVPWHEMHRHSSKKRKGR